MDAVILLPGEVIELKSKPEISFSRVVGGTKRRVEKAVLIQQTRGQMRISVQPSFFIPKVGCQIIGVVKEVRHRCCLLEIGVGVRCWIDNAAFNGATLHNHPTLRTGDLLFCKVEHVHGDMGVQVSCTDKKDLKDWSSG